MASISSQEEEVPLPIQTGPKGVINDWRKFKLDGAGDMVPPNQKELLRQMSRPQSDDAKERSVRKMSAADYQLLRAEDEGGRLRRYRKRCMLETRERLSFGPTFDGGVHALPSGEAFLEVVGDGESEHRRLAPLVVVHVYKDGVAGCGPLNRCLDCLAGDYPGVKFCKIDAAATGAAERFPDDALPALLVYKAGQLLGNFVSVTRRFDGEFFAADVEAFLNEYGLLPEKELGCRDDQEEGEGEEGGDVE